MSRDISPEEFEELLPRAVAWAEAEEVRILKSGRPLTEWQLSDAQQVGVRHPARVRVLAVPSIPLPEDPILREAGEAAGLITPHTAGLALRYGIFVRSELANDRFLVAHELVHTAQYERFGSVETFLRQYVQECLTVGYPAAPLEQEAIRLTAQLRAS